MGQYSDCPAKDSEEENTDAEDTAGGRQCPRNGKPALGTPGCCERTLGRCFPCNKFVCCRPVLRFDIDDLAEHLHEFWHDPHGPGPSKLGSAQLPGKLQGVFWLSDNPAPETAATFYGVRQLDAERRSFVLDTPGQHNWSFCNTRAGWIFYYGMELLNCNLKFNFNDDWTFADMRLRCLGCIPCPYWIARYTIRQVDEAGDVWERETFLFTRKYEYGSYTMKRVVAKDGTKLPDYAEMVRQAHERVKVRGTTRKPRAQFTTPW